MAGWMTDWDGRREKGRFARRRGELNGEQCRRKRMALGEAELGETGSEC